MSGEVRMFKFSEEIPGRRWTRKTVIDGETMYHYAFKNAVKAEQKLINDVIRGLYECGTDQRTSRNKSITGIFAMVRRYFRFGKSKSEQHFRRTGRT